MREDLEHLRLLAIFHFVVAGLAALASCIPLIYVAIGIAIVTDEFRGPPRIFGWFLILFAMAFTLAGWAFAISLTFAGRSLQQRQRHTFCIVMAALACAFFPFGTVLGVLSILVLSRPSVKDLFADATDRSHPDDNYRD